MSAALERTAEEANIIADMDSLLSIAFHPLQSAKSSPIAQFDGRKRSQRSGKVQLKRTSSKWTERVQATETQKAQYSRPLMEDATYSFVKVVRAVNELPEMQLCYVRYKYMPASTEQFQYGVRFGRMFWTLTQRHFEEGSKVDTRNQVKRMCDSMILSEANLMLQLLMEKSKLWEVFGIERKTWYATYRDYWIKMREDLADVADEALLAVARRIEQ